MLSPKVGFALIILCLVSNSGMPLASADIKARLKELAASLGHPPTVDDMLPLASQIGADEREGLWDAFVSIQEPALSKGDLRAIVLANRESIRSLKFIADWQQTIEPDTTPGFHRIYELTSAGGRHVRKLKELGPNRVVLSIDLVAYDGALRRSHHVAGGAGGATVGAFQGWSEFFIPPAHVLFAVMQIDGPTTLDRPAPADDLVAFIDQQETAVFSGYQTFEGRKCIVIGTPEASIWLDADRHYVVLKQVTYRMEEGADGVPKRAPAFTRLNENLKDFGDGIWLPQSAKRIAVDQAGKTSTDLVTFTDMQVNPAFAESEFVDVVPVGTLVSDTVKKISYYAGKNGSVEKMLNEEVPLAPPARNSYLIVGFNFAVIVLVIGLYIWKRSHAR